MSNVEKGRRTREALRAIFAQKGMEVKFKDIKRELSFPISQGQFYSHRAAIIAEGPIQAVPVGQNTAQQNGASPAELIAATVHIQRLIGGIGLESVKLILAALEK